MLGIFLILPCNQLHGSFLPCNQLHGNYIGYAYGICYAQHATSAIGTTDIEALSFNPMR